jgi:hypothetical protein
MERIAPSLPSVAVEGLLSLDGGANPIYVLARDVLLTESGYKPFLVDRLATPTPYYTGLLALSPFFLDLGSALKAHYPL